VIADHGERFEDIRKSTAGAIFLGVPMQGCKAADIMAWGQRALGNNQPLLNTLREGNQELLSLSQDFWSGYGHLPIVCFFENQDSSYGSIQVKVRRIYTLSSLSKLNRSKLSQQTVGFQSATLVGKRRILLNANHSGLNKFRGEDDENFQLLLPEVKSIVEYATTRHLKGTYQEYTRLLAGSLTFHQL
jgi:hypothetical protein